MRTIHRLFGKSPFGPLIEHTRRVHETVKLLHPLLEAFFAEDWQRCEELYEKISRSEHDADVQKNEVRDHLPKSMFLPVDRGDLLHYLKEQDAIADAVEDLAVLISLRRLSAPEGLEPVTMELADQVVATVDRLEEAGTELAEVFEASFAGPEVERVLEMVSQVNDQEWEADKRQRRATQELLDHQDELDPVSIMLWMQLLEVLGEVANAAENSGDLLRMMLARR